MSVIGVGGVIIDIVAIVGLLLLGKWLPAMPCERRTRSGSYIHGGITLSLSLLRSSDPYLLSAQVLLDGQYMFMYPTVQVTFKICVCE